MSKNLSVQAKTPYIFKKVCLENPIEVQKLIKKLFPQCDDDFVQDCFVDILDNWCYKYNPSFGTSVSTSICCLARQKYFNTYKKASSEKFYRNQYRQSLPQDNTYIEDDACITEEVMRYIDTLDPRDQEFVKKRFFEGKKYEDIAQELGISSTSAFVNVSKVIEQLRSKFNVN